MRRFFPVVFTILLLLYGCGQKPSSESWSERPSNEVANGPARNGQSANASGNSGEGYDLSHDEDRGGHTLRKHVGRSDDQLRQRLARERNISAASTHYKRAPL